MDLAELRGGRKTSFDGRSKPEHVSSCRSWPDPGRHGPLFSARVLWLASRHPPMDSSVITRKSTGYGVLHSSSNTLLYSTLLVLLNFLNHDSMEEH